MLRYVGAQRLIAQGLATGDELPELPDLLAYYYWMERMHWAHLPWPGGLSDQPHQLMWELDCVDDAIQEDARLVQLTQVAFAKGLGQLSGLPSGTEDT